MYINSSREEMTNRCNILGCLLITFVSVFFCGCGVDSGENEKSVSWLPESASDVSYYLVYGSWAYEFRITESDFLEWAKENDWPPEKIAGEPVSITRYTRMMHQDDTRKIIKDGYYFENLQENGGGTYVAYDTNTNYAYFYRQAR